MEGVGGHFGKSDSEGTKRGLRQRLRVDSIIRIWYVYVLLIRSESM